MDGKMKWTSVLLTALMLAGCGGGGSDSDSEVPPTSETPGTGDPTDPEVSPEFGALQRGYFLNADVNGLSYVTGDKEGVITGGELPYYEKEPATVTLGQTTIGETAGAMVIPFSSLQDGVIAADYWTNAAVLLHMADDDGDPTNGIAISEASRSAADSYQMDLNVNYSTFVTTNSSALDDIASSTAAGPRAVTSEATAEAWVSEIKNTLNNALVFSEESYFLYGSNGGYEGGLVFENGGTGLVWTSSTGAPETGFAGDNSAALDGWGAASLEGVSGVRGFYFDINGSRWECYGLKVMLPITEIACSNQGDIALFKLTPYEQLMTGGETTFDVLAQTDLWLYDSAGVEFPNPVAANNVFAGAFDFIPSGGTYVGYTGSWSADGYRFDVDGTTNDLDTVVGGQLGPHALFFYETEADTLESKTRVAVSAGTVLEDEHVSGKTFDRFDMNPSAAIESLTLNSDGSTSAGYTWSFADSNRQLMLNGATYNRCTFAGNLGSDLFFACDDSVSGSVIRYEYWKAQ